MTAAERRSTKPIDFFRPIIADCDTGHGGVGTTMKCVQMFIENGASGVHIEDQVPGAKKVCVCVRVCACVCVCVCVCV